MLSEKRRAANKANAQRSTGPRSSGGKMRARVNALKHGFASTQLADGDMHREVAALSRRIMGVRNDPVLIMRAHAIAESELQIRDVRRAKLALVEASESDIISAEAKLGLGAPALQRLDRYESSARRRRDRALLEWLRAVEVFTGDHNNDMSVQDEPVYVERLQNEPNDINAVARVSGIDGEFRKNHAD